MKVEVEISDLDLLEFGKGAIAKELQNSLKWLKMRRNFAGIAQEFQAHWQFSDQQQLTEIPSEVWQEYKKDLKL
ncbi:MAG: hypothetical protein LVT47_04035 [Cyanobacteria bacterium LVE1205-1]|jgi:hypothetical protein